MKNKILLSCFFLVSIFEHGTLTGNQQSLENKVTSKIFKNILLIVNFNHPYYENIEFLKKLYSPFFEKIIFYGEEYHPEVIQVKTQHGFYICDVLFHALQNYSNVEGYLFLEDDCILNIWNLFSLNFNKIWLLPGFTGSPTNVIYQPHYIWTNMASGAFSLASWWGWQWLSVAKEAFAKLKEKDKKMMETNFGKNILVGTAADMFYFPKKFREEILRLCPLFKNVFIEITIPTILGCLESKDHWEKVSIWHTTSTDYITEYLKKQWPIKHTCIHPVKLSNQVNRKTVTDIFKKMIPNTYN